MRDIRGRASSGAEIVDFVITECAASSAHAGHTARKRRVPEDLDLATRIASLHVIAIASNRAAKLERVIATGHKGGAVISLHEGLRGCVVISDQHCGGILVHAGTLEFRRHAGEADRSGAVSNRRCA